MANVIKPKRSYTATTVPTGLVAGEIAVNATDGKIWICNAAGTVNVLISSLTRSDHTGTLAVASGGTGVTTSTGSGNIVLSSSPTLVTPTIGAATATSLNKITVTAPATGATLTIADGATLTASATASVSGTNTGDNATNTNYSGLVSNATHTGDATGATALTVVKINGVLMSGLATGILKNTTSTGAPSIATAGTDYVAPSGALGTPTSGTLTNCTFPTLNQNTTGSAASLSATLAVASGGTGLATLTANNVILGNGTSAPTFVAPSTSGNLLTSNGTTWQSTAPASSSMPTGALMPYAGSSAPTGYLLCDGSSVSSSTYLALHAVISNTYGGTAYSGAGALSFNLPDLRGRLPMGAGTGTGLNASGTGAPSGTAQTARTRGAWLGEETHLLTTTNMPSHSHNGATGNAGSHSHTQGSYPGFIYVGSGGNSTTSSGSNWIGSTGYTLTNTVADHSHTIPANGGDGRHATIPPVVVLNYIIKT